MLAGSQVASGTHAGIYLRPDIGCQYSRLIYTARFIVWQPRRAAAAGTSTNWRLSEPFLFLHREHGTGCQRSWNCCDRQTCFVVIWKHFCFILSMDTRKRIDFVICPRSSSRGCNTSASATVTWIVTFYVQNVYHWLTHMPAVTCGSFHGIVDGFLWYSRPMSCSASLNSAIVFFCFECSL